MSVLVRQRHCPADHDPFRISRDIIFAADRLSDLLGSRHANYTAQVLRQVYPPKSNPSVFRR